MVVMLFSLLAVTILNSIVQVSCPQSICCIHFHTEYIQNISVLCTNRSALLLTMCCAEEQKITLIQRVNYKK
jgi:hypothetical protein